MIKKIQMSKEDDRVGRQFQFEVIFFLILNVRSSVILHS